MIKIRFYNEADAREILDVHRAAVTKTAAQDYSLDILEEWSPPVDDMRFKDFKCQPLPDIRVVADIGGLVVGFGELKIKENLVHACYVHPEYGRRGVGCKILSRLQEIALGKGLTYLVVDSSITAEKFYNSHGYKTISYGQYSLRSGRKMACVRMRKEFSS